MSLQRTGNGAHPACRRGLDFLRERQQGGTWPEPEYTGTGFPGDFYLNYGMYRHLFPTMALGMAGGLEQIAGARGDLVGRRSTAVGTRVGAKPRPATADGMSTDTPMAAGRTVTGPSSESPAPDRQRED
jgi:squalene-hopene/tetraprenyl-beta-curcumene cyclase